MRKIRVWQSVVWFGIVAQHMGCVIGGRWTLAGLID